jgi:YggT family protein
MSQALYFVVRTLAQLLMFVVLLRFWLPWLRADFRNPVAQGILKMTSPLIIPLRRFLPSIGRLDTATVLILLVFQYLTVVLLLVMSGRMADPFSIALVSVLELAIVSLNLFFFAVLIMVILSWVAPQAYSPITAFVSAIAQPILRPFRRLIPTIGGLDISPIFAIILLQAGVIFLQSLKPFPF